MEVKVLKNKEELGKAAAEKAAEILKERIAKNGKARLVLSTGASQFETLKELVASNVDWSKVEMFHLDEYIDLPADHPASFRNYLKSRFVERVNIEKVHYVDGQGDIQNNIKLLSEEIKKEPIDIGLIGIGENAHIAFNDPPADFDTEEPYIIVNLDEQCRQQQVNEGWFPSIEDVPKKAITMSVHQILQCDVIISSVPGSRKANAIKSTIDYEETERIPATKLKGHSDWTLFLDSGSSSLLDM
ncbi:glucosamine-6-phosphate deaminase [Lederbergia panacisoli]|uniref:glucosamine-6-phosphate deaminase n=1 Tax=Lederbergia panacisoli TaxID=1255251 RepID=UPI00214C4989|nr:glucosamine-6-phosphate deaminase [Lederbergia panacisoli]MCR2821193.1 glucosamine-6-phosphate deaminase [Lederbergia panacisoli]